MEKGDYKLCFVCESPVFYGHESMQYMRVLADGRSYMYLLHMFCMQEEMKLKVYDRGIIGV